MYRIAKVHCNYYFQNLQFKGRPMKKKEALLHCRILGMGLAISYRQPEALDFPIKGVLLHLMTAISGHSIRDLKPDDSYFFYRKVGEGVFWRQNIAA